jgi:NADH pyrophosphatase NudC (nudix superfamily)
VVRVQERIAGLMECGATLERVAREVIEPSGLSSEKKAALRLFAFAMAGPQSEAIALPGARESGANGHLGLPGGG